MLIPLLFSKNNMHSFLPVESSQSSDPQVNIPVVEDIGKDGEDAHISQREALSCHVAITHLWNRAKSSEPSNQTEVGREYNRWGTLLHGANDHLQLNTTQTEEKMENRRRRTLVAPLIINLAGDTFFMYPSHSLSSAVRASWRLLIAESCLSPSGTK